MKLGFLYAGQGAQHPGMGADLYQEFSAFRAAFDAAKLPFDLHELCFSDPKGLLVQTRYTQPAMVAFAAGLTAVLAEEGVFPFAAVGLSLGEYSALHAAGVWDAKTAVETVAFRGLAMEKAAEGVDCAMKAVLGLDAEPLRQACAEASELGVAELCNYNCPGQIVIGGETPAVERAAVLAKQAGAKRCLPLKVSGPFHTSLLRSAGSALAEYLRGVPFAEPSIPVLHNCLGRERREGDETVEELLARQVSAAVRLEECIRRMAALGVDAVVEIGPGRALSGFVRKTVPSLPVFSVETSAEARSLPMQLRALEKESEVRSA